MIFIILQVDEKMAAWGKLITILRCIVGCQGVVQILVITGMVPLRWGLVSGIVQMFYLILDQFNSH